ncbi:type II secretion system minor pseudopilin GspJ [Yersinia nurmii]|uniref:Type II secretion system protein J n=1 Tax=Yersinia nurmii TaxID=685706 RepID=A0AAW7K160_9GAMM|nr:type II secretion system minor pseudopilin GspJ [Yersinia nurmii]MDN0087716.1 type II secretion system minor pseudopilin GspJ [Yersinia nurmii]
MFQILQGDKLIHKYNDGFTFIEVILAISIFSLLSLAMYQVLQVTLRTTSNVISHLYELDNIINSIYIIESDITHAIVRPPKEITNDGPLDFFVGNSEGVSDSIEIVRNNKFNVNSVGYYYQLEKVGYKINNNNLERIRAINVDDGLFYPQMSGEIIKERILTGVKSIRFRFFSNGKWLDYWNEFSKHPRAIEIILDLDRYGEINKIIMMNGSD